MMMAPLEGSGDTFRIGVIEPVLDIGWAASLMSYDVSPDGKRFLVLTADESARSTSLSLVLNWKQELESR